MSVNLRRKVPNNKISIQQWLKNAVEILQRAEIPSARLDSELLLVDALEVDRTWLVAHADDIIEASTANDTLQRRSQREPLAYIRGWQEFYGRRFTVNASTLIPRPESETIIDILKELPLSTLPHRTILDIGTGSGCLGITAALELRDTDVTLVDVSTEALTVARENIRIHTAEIQRNNSKVTDTISDLLSDLESTPSIILANLPYVDISWECSPETRYEPSLALFAEEHGLALIHRLIEQARAQLMPGGYLLLEADIRQLQAIEQFALKHGFSAIVVRDYIIALQRQV